MVENPGKFVKSFLFIAASTDVPKVVFSNEGYEADEVLSGI